MSDPFVDLDKGLGIAKPDSSDPFAELDAGLSAKPEKPKETLPPLPGLLGPQMISVPQSVVAGAARGFLEPLSLLPPVNDVVERLKQYSGDNFGSKVGYTLGFLGGFAIPGGAELKLGEDVARAAGLTLEAADGAAKLTKGGQFVAGIVAGALYGAGRHAESIPEYISHVVSDASLGGVGDVAINAAWNAVASRFGDKASQEIVDYLNGLGKDGKPAEKLDDKAVEAHARAMQVFDQMNRTDLTPEQQRYNEALIARGKAPAPAPAENPDAAVDIAGNRLGLQLGLSELNLPHLEPGKLVLLPDAHNDSESIQYLLDRVPGIKYSKVKAADGNSFLIGLEQDFDPKIVEHFNQNGFMPGQELLYKGGKYIAIKPAKNGMMITKPGRLKSPFYVANDDVQLLPIATNLGRQEVSSLAPLAADFIGKYSLWPKTQGFDESMEEFAKNRGLSGIDKLRLMDYTINLQKKMLAQDEPELGQVFERLDQEFERTRGLTHPDGPVIEKAAEKGLIPLQQKRADGSWGYVFKNSAGQTISAGKDTQPLLEGQALKWLRSYGVEPPEIGPQLPVSKNLISTTATPALPAHTAAELSSKTPRFHPAWNLFADLLPRGQIFLFAEDQLKAQGFNDIKPFTGVFNPISDAKIKFRNEMRTWLKGGVVNTPTGSEKVEGLLNIFNPRKSPVRQDFKEKFYDMMEQPRSMWSSFAKDNGLNDKEVAAAGKLRDWLNNMWDRHVQDEKINISFDDFIENYMPHYRAKSDAKAEGSLTTDKYWLGKEKQMSKPAIRFASEMQRKGILKKYEKDPFMVSMQYLRAGLFKSYMKEPIENAIKELNKIPKGNQDLDQLKESMLNYIKLSAYSAPEDLAAFRNAVNNVTNNLGIELTDETKEQVINTLINMNYGAYMSWRPGLALRNLSQTLFSTLPMLGSRATGHGITAAFAGKAAWKEAYDAGAIVSEHIVSPVSEAVYDEVAQHIREATGSKLVKASVSGAVKAARVSEALGSKGLSWFRKADDVNRVIAYHGQVFKLRNAWNKYADKEISKEVFERKAGLNFFGPTIKGEFYSRSQKSADDAIKWVGAQAAHSTQWLYQLGAGPALFSHGVGRLAGQYGTWPTWYASYLAEGMKNLQGIERAKFAAWNMAVHAAFGYGGAAVGLNLWRWTGLSSLTWMGGPLVDYFSDLRDVVSGVTDSGEATAARTLALSHFGLQDTGEGVSLLPDFLGGRIHVKDPKKFAMSFFAPVTPGYLMARNLYEIANGDMDMWQATLKAMDVPQDAAGAEWPEIHGH